MTRRLLNLLTALSTAVGLCASPQTAHAQRGGEPPEVIHLVRGGDRLFVKTSVGGQDVGYFGIDTGSDWTHLSAATAKRLNPKPLGETNYENDRGGTDREPVAWLDEIQLDAIKRPHWPIAVSKNLGPIHGGEVAGIFGTDVCRGKPFTLDFHDATLTIWDPRSFVPPAGAREFPLREFRGTPLVQCTVEGITSWFVLDSG